MKPYLNAAMALFLLSAAPLAVQAAEPKIKVVRVIGDDIRVPIPDGFCEPEGPFQDNARLAEASDTQNVTFLVPGGVRLPAAEIALQPIQPPERSERIRKLRAALP